MRMAVVVGPCSLSSRDRSSSQWRRESESWGAFASRQVKWHSKRRIGARLPRPESRSRKLTNEAIRASATARKTLRANARCWGAEAMGVYRDDRWAPRLPCRRRGNKRHNNAPAQAVPMPNPAVPVGSNVG